MFVGALRVELYLPDCGSLKEKRKVIKSIIDKARSRFNVAVAEVDKHDLWQVSSLGFTCVSPSESVARETLMKVERWVRSLGTAEVLESPIDIFTS